MYMDPTFGDNRGGSNTPTLGGFSIPFLSLFMGFYVCHLYAVNRISMFHVEANGHVNTINRQRPPVPICTHHDNSLSASLWTK